MPKSLLLLLMLLCMGCSPIRSTQKKLNSGAYDATIEKALKELRPNKTKKSARPYLFLLQEAFIKAQERDTRFVSQMQSANSLKDRRRVYETYLQLDSRQEKIRPLLPLIDPKRNKEIPFPFKNYERDKRTAQAAFSKILFAQTDAKLQEALPRYFYRELHDHLSFLDQNALSAPQLSSYLDQTYQRGVSILEGHLINDSDQLLHKQVARQLLHFSPIPQIGFWMHYYPDSQAHLQPNFALQIHVKEITMSPETLREIISTEEKEIKGARVPARDEKGNVIVDQQGDVVETHQIENVVATFYKTIQQKTANVAVEIEIKNLETGYSAAHFTLASNWVFHHEFATYKGNKKALSPQLIALLNDAKVPFPSDLQMLLDASKDLNFQLLLKLKQLQL